MHYRDFAERAGCTEETNSNDSSTFDCLVRADTETLQYASGNVSTAGAWGTWAFLPVTDGEFIQDLPSRQLLEKKVSGKRILSGVSQHNLACQIPRIHVDAYRIMPMMVSPSVLQS